LSTLTEGGQGGRLTTDWFSISDVYKQYHTVLSQQHHPVVHADSRLESIRFDSLNKLNQIDSVSPQN